MYLISDEEYVITDRENIGIDDLTIRVELLHQEDFQPALWYAQTRTKRLGIEWDKGCIEEHYLEPTGDIEAGTVQLLLESYKWDAPKLPAEWFELDSLNSIPGDRRFEVHAMGDSLVILDRVMALCCSIEREALQDTSFDLFNWHREELLKIKYKASISADESYATVEYSGSELDAESRSGLTSTLYLEQTHPCLHCGKLPTLLLVRLRHQNTT
jgi:hypothetical protein